MSHLEQTVERQDGPMVRGTLLRLGKPWVQIPAVLGQVPSLGQDALVPHLYTGANSTALSHRGAVRINPCLGSMVMGVISI